MGRRTLLLIAALVVAALGTVLIFIYVKGADDRAQDDATIVEVLVATQKVEAGTTAGDASSAGAFEIAEVPDSARADGALADVSIVSDQVALSPIFPGQQILAQMFGAPGTNSTLAVPKGKLAISVQLGDPERVAGFVVPGSDVAIFATVTPQGGLATEGETTRVLLPTVEVIGVGASTVTTQTTTTDSGESTTSEIPQTILTLSVDQTDAEKVINAQTSGSLYFALLSDDAKVRTDAGTNSQNLFR
jgi:pilus assembly protein CpaB